MNMCPTCGTQYPDATRICTTDGTVLEAVHAGDPQLGKVLDGKYRLEALLGQGGMGSLYRATHVMLDKAVAVKLIKSELVTSPDTVRRFQREARAASNLHHPNIVSVYDLGQTHDGTLYIAMELIDGPSLNEAIRRGGPMETSRAVDLLRQVGSALSLAHRNQIVHRDLKPHNIMLTKGVDGRELAKLLDFGIAKTFNESATQLTMTGLVIGTPQYMAPEQAAGKAVDARSDLYSLGVIVYEMLVGEVPFTADSTPVVLMKHMTEVPAAPSVRFPNLAISPELERISLRCLEKDPDKRFQHADEFVAALDAVDVASGASAATVIARPSRANIADAATVPMKRTPAPPAAAPPTATRAHAAPVVAAPPQVPVSGVRLPPSREASADHRSLGGGGQPDLTNPPKGGSHEDAFAAAPAPVVPLPAMAEPAPRSKAPLVVAAAIVLLLVALGMAYRQGYLSRLAAPVQQAALVETPAAPSPPSAAPPPTATEPPPAAAPASTPAASTSPAVLVPLDSARPSTELGTTLSLSKGRDSAPPPPPAAPPSSNVPGRVSAAAPVTSATRADSNAAGPSSRPAGDSRSGPPSQGFGTGRPRPNPFVRGGGASQFALPRGQTPAVATASPSPARSAAPASAPGTAPPPAASAQESPRASPSLPENPPVFLQCTGPAEACAALRTPMEQALQKAGLSSVRNPERAEVIVKATVTVLDERVDRQFGATFAVRTYSIDVDAETARSSEGIPMPPPRTFSFDQRLGRERLTENARVLADEVVEQVRAFWKKRK